ncbi:MAG: hypothetical protein PUG04_04645 [Lachnospiraceae bacterium]|nr:hypothetical protein [Lachnospiraceae bacterium]
MSLSIGRISGISTSPLSAVGTRNYAYNVSNESEVSDVYAKRISNIDPSQEVDPVSPVKYASAARSSDKAAESKEASAGFNDLASAFQIGGYDNSGSSYAYSVVGKNYDEFA